MITANDILKILTQRIVDLNYKESDNEILIFPIDEAGYAITIYYHPIETIVFYGDNGFHDHFRGEELNCEDFLNELVAHLVGDRRIIEYSQNGKIINWKEESKNRFDKWSIASEMHLPKWKFWRKKTPITSMIKMNRYVASPF